jgi:hypothetical protein
MPDHAMALRATRSGMTTGKIHGRSPFFDGGE